MNDQNHQSYITAKQCLDGNSPQSEFDFKPCKQTFARLLRGLNDRDFPSMGVVRSGSPLQHELADLPAIGTGMRNGLDVFTVRTIRAIRLWISAAKYRKN